MIKAPKGTRDLTGPEGQAFTQLETVSRRIFDQYHFSELRTPIFESVDLFSRSLGSTSDVVQKEMFSFTDRGDRAFALRPEGTAGVVRHFLENKLFVKGGVHRFFYMGPMFRAERPQAGRYRQFWQVGSEHFGDGEPTADADTVLLVGKILNEFGLKNVTVQVNSLGCKTCRTKYRKELLAYLKTKEKILNAESKSRMEKNPLRVLDSKEDGPKLKDAPVMKDFLCEACQDHYKRFLDLVKIGDVSIEENPRLVRGLDYYTRTVFEFVSPDLGAQNALAAGGRYDDLVAELGGPSIPAVGFALGMDRLVSARDKADANGSSLKNGLKRVFVAPMSPEAVNPAYKIAHNLRHKGISVPPIQMKKKIKNSLSQAVDFGATWAILIGEDELAKNEATVKNLETREQSKVPFDKVVSFISK